MNPLMPMAWVTARLRR